MTPSRSLRTRTPSSTAPASPASTIVGTAVAGFQMLHGQLAAACVVKLHVTSAASALPARSFTRGSIEPPCTRAV